MIHDELDLELGKVKLKFGGGNGGHNGLSSIDEMIGNNYNRIRIGINHPGSKDLVSNYVLNKFTKDLYNTGLFLNITLNIKNKILEINVKEYPIINKVSPA